MGRVIKKILKVVAGLFALFVILVASAVYRVNNKESNASKTQQPNTQVQSLLSQSIDGKKSPESETPKVVQEKPKETKPKVTQVKKQEKKPKTKNTANIAPPETTTKRNLSGCDCSSNYYCTGSRGGKYCITSGGKKRYLK